MLQSLFPPSLVESTVSISDLPVAMCLVSQVAAFVVASVWPVFITKTVELAVYPPTNIFSAVGPPVDAKATDFVLVQFAFEECAVRKGNRAFALFLAGVKHSLVLHTVRPRLHSFSMLLILLPHALIRRAIVISVLTKSICHVIFPVTLVRAPVLVD